MRILSSLATLLLVGGLNGCGQSDEKAPATSEQTAPVSPKAVEKSPVRPAELPKMLIAKVPVDANGVELNDQAEVREVFVDSTVTDGAAAHSVFASASNESISVENELDLDSSSNQWWWGSRRYYYWNTPWYPGKLLGRGLWWGRNPYTYWGGQSYPYYYNNHYNYNNCNYYYYSSY
jgi:hypothetical protein